MVVIDTCLRGRESVTLARMLALKLREPAPAEATVCDEYWIGQVESCGNDWIFSVIAPDDDIETFVYASETAAECARTALFRTLCPAVAIVHAGAES